MDCLGVLFGEGNVDAALHVLKMLEDQFPFISIKPQSTLYFPAYRSGNKWFVEYLKSKEVPLLKKLKDDYGNLLIHVAAAGGNVEMVEDLYDEYYREDSVVKFRSVVHKRNKNMQSTLTIAVEGNHTKVVQFLLKEEGRVDNSMMVVAAGLRNVELMEELLGHEGYANASAAPAIGKNITSTISRAVFSNDSRVLRILLQHGGDSNNGGEYCGTNSSIPLHPLHISVQMECVFDNQTEPQMTPMLLHHGSAKGGSREDFVGIIRLVVGNRCHKMMRALLRDAGNLLDIPLALRMAVRNRDQDLVQMLHVDQTDWVCDQITQSELSWLRSLATDKEITGDCQQIFRQLFAQNHADPLTKDEL